MTLLDILIKFVYFFQTLSAHRLSQSETSPDILYNDIHRPLWSDIYAPILSVILESLIKNPSFAFQQKQRVLVSFFFLCVFFVYL